MSTLDFTVIDLDFPVGSKNKTATLITGDEQAFLIECGSGSVLVYVMEVGDVERSRHAAEQSSHPIDADHRRVMQLAVGDAVPSELLLDLHP